MRIENPYKCDVCGLSKGDGNGWFIGSVIGSGIKDSSLSFVDDARHDGEIQATSVGYAIIQWDSVVADESSIAVHHLCSESCALKKQSVYLRR